MKLTPEELAEISRISNRKRVEDGTHNFLKKNIKTVVPKKGSPIGDRQLAILKTKEFNNNRVKNGTHPFLGKNLNQSRLDNKTHNTLLEHTCPHCGKIGKGPPMFQWHFDRCKFR